MAQSKEEQSVEISLSGGGAFLAQQKKPVFFLLNQRMDTHHDFTLHYPPVAGTDSLNSEIGKRISIRLKGDENELAFEGIITGIEREKRANGTGHLAIRGKSLTYLLDRGRTFDSFDRQTPAAIFQEMTQRAKLEGFTQINPQQEPARLWSVQYNESDFQFLQRIAGQSGWFYCDGQLLHWGRNPNPPEVELAFGEHLLSFQETANLAPLDFSFSNHDYENNHRQPVQPDTYDGGNALFNALQQAARQVFAKGVEKPRVFAESEQANPAEIAKNKQRQRLVGMVGFGGQSIHPSLTVGTRASVKHKERDRDYFITAVQHKLEANGQYANSFSAIPWESARPPRNPSLSKPFALSAIATVTDAADALGRVRIQFDWQVAGNKKTPPLRVLSPQANNGSGHFFMPEKKSRVLVTFEHGDPQRPIVEGSTCHGHAKPDTSYRSDDNDFKGITTAGGSRLFFSDKKGEEHCWLATPGNASIVRLTVKNGGEIFVEASKGIVSLKATNLRIEASEGLELTGKNIILNARENLRLSAAKLLEISAEKGRFRFVKNLLLQGGSIVKMLFEKIFLN